MRIIIAPKALRLLAARPGPRPPSGRDHSGAQGESVAVTPPGTSAARLGDTGAEGPERREVPWVEGFEPAAEATATSDRRERPVEENIVQPIDPVGRRARGRTAA